MSKGNTTTVTHPDGTKSTRTSKSKIYTHAVEVHTVRNADRLIKNAQGGVKVCLSDIAKHDNGTASEWANRAYTERRLAEYQAKLEELLPLAGTTWVEYGVFQWSQSAANAAKGLKKATFVSSYDGSIHTARVVEVDK